MNAENLMNLPVGDPRRVQALAEQCVAAFGPNAEKMARDMSRGAANKESAAEWLAAADMIANGEAGR